MLVGLLLKYSTYQALLYFHHLELAIPIYLTARGNPISSEQLPCALPHATPARAGAFPTGLSPGLGVPAPATRVRCRHRLLEPAQFHSVLDRLVNMSDLSCPLQLFSSVKIGHRDWRGEQFVHAIPFDKAIPTMVRLHRIFMYRTCICMYLYVSVCIFDVSAPM